MREPQTRSRTPKACHHQGEDPAPASGGLERLANLVDYGFGMSGPSSDLASTGWIRNMPAPAFRAYFAIWYLSRERAALVGDLDEEGAAFWVSQVAPRGLDEPYDPSDENEWTEDLENEEALWREWRGYAEDRDRPLRSCRDVIEFMIELGLIERFEEGVGDVRWRVANPLPHIEDVLPLSVERKEIESQFRWRQSFSGAVDAITVWIAERRSSAVAKSEFETSIQAIAADLELDPEDVRHALAILLNEDVRCDVDPETAASDAPLSLRVDWKLFEEWRGMYFVARPEDDKKS